MIVIRTSFLRIACAFMALSVSSCAKDVEPTEPEGGLEAFVVALASGEPEAIYAQLTPDTQAVCQRALESLIETNEAIDLLQASDQADARAATGVGLLQHVETPEALFAEVVDITRLPPLDEGGGYRDGTRAKNTVYVAADTAMVATRAGQEFELVRDEDGNWRVREPMLALVIGAFANIETNRQRVDQAVTLFGEGAEIDDELRTLGLLE